jgi:hypothetical protein
MITFHYQKRKFTNVAAEYNELTGKQLIALSEITGNDLPEDAAKLKALKVLLGFSLYRFSLIPMDAKAAMIEHITWVFEKNTLTTQLITSYKYLFGKKLYGPADAFDNLTMGEWNACEIYYDLLVQHEDEGALTNLVAVLYRRAKENYNTKLDSDGDIRVEFNPNEISYHAKTVKRWPLNVKLAILFWYDGCREHLKSLYDLFGSGGDGTEEPGMFELIRGLCGDRYGSFKEVEKINVHLVMRELELMKKEAAEIERQMNSVR